MDDLSPGYGLSPSAPMEEIVSDVDISPPPYSALPPQTSEGLQWSASHSNSSQSQKLGYVDFVPRVVKKHVLRDDDYEQFDALIQRANDWLLEHDGTRVISCETITWTGLNRKYIFSDNSLFAKSIEANKPTTLIRGLRLWYMTDSVPRADRSTSQPVVLHSRTYMPDKKENFDDFIARINENISKKPLQGMLVTVETLSHHFSGGDDYHPSIVRPYKTFWKEMPQTDKRIIFFVRLFSVTGQGSASPEAIGYKDFIPERNQRNSDNNGYELFSELMELANRWVARQQGVRFTNLQSLNVKLKRDDEAFEQRCMYREHRCANGRFDLKGPNKVTQYLRMLRVFFAAPIKTAGGTSNVNILPPRLTYRTFAPAQIAMIGDKECSGFDDIVHVVNRINQWLKITGARIFGVETLCQRLAVGGLGLLGPEATYSRHGLVDTSRILFLHYIRVYFDGEYIEPAGATSSFVTPNSDAFSRL